MKNISDTDKQNLINDLYDDLNLYLESNPIIDITIDKSDTDDYYENGLHCSKLGWCVRSEVMSYYNFPKKPLTLQTKLTFMRGNFYHELVYKWLERKSLRNGGYFGRFTIVEKEWVISDGLPKPYRGKLDCRIYDEENDLAILADIKTANSNMFKKYSSFLPKDDNVKQLTSYYRAMLELDYRIDLLLMMYFSSSSDHPQFYFVEPYKDIDNEMNKYIKAVNDYEITKELPPRLDDILDKNKAWQCSYCDFINISCEGLLKGNTK